MFGRRHPLVDLARDEYNLKHSLGIPESFESIVQANSHLDLLASGVFRLRGDLIAIAEREALISEGTPFDSPRRQCYIQALSRSVDPGSDWHQILSRQRALEAGMAALWRAMEALGRPSKGSTDRAIMALQIQYVLVLFTVSTCRETFERVCDGFNDLFENAVDLGQAYIQSIPRFSDSSPKRSISLEPGIIPTIYLVASKCRNVEIRKKAIRLLRDGCMQEAIWDGKPFALFIQKLADLEQAKAINHMQNESGSHVVASEAKTHTSDIPEHARFADIWIADELDDQGRGRLVCARYRHETDGRIEITEHTVPLTGLDFSFCGN